MRTAIYIIVTLVALLGGYTYKTTQDFLSEPQNPSPIAIPRVVRVTTRHDEIFVGQFALGFNRRSNAEKLIKWQWSIYHPNLRFELIGNGIVNVGRFVDEQWERTVQIDRDREDRLFRAGCWIVIDAYGAHHVPRQATNYTTLAAIISQQIMTNYVVVDEPRGATPPGIPDTAWTIQAKLNPEPDQWPERLVVNVESPGIWVHLGGGKYQWRRLPPF